MRARAVRSLGSRIRRCPLAFCLALGVAACDVFVVEPEGPEGPGSGGIEDAVTALVNDHREALGCPRLVWDGNVAKVALEHSVDMLERDYFGHLDPEGRGLRERLMRARIEFYYAAENIAEGFRYDNAAEAVFEGWMTSPEHRKIIEDCEFVIHGIGFADFHWTHVFMR